ncbi:Gluconolactonase [Streptomyces venezuelae]|uniref:SMP-30/gluconolactonase/LRE family protein n=1 Tax=Streptomyces gardneri TaxID=66892 RepID=UPI0006BC9518|nr:SMP-30/gluconolactonase/LRE family protein [Streptomyces gardneri]ALO12430.1 Gluconolactonase [Streptomyces venezuelae]QPK49209.1 SMP-30/gluconolactonase/LRE family protein [Streptomyces gardneri]WRK40716.1 SMP-30/gluconolactonase/LRE family protein [Streptomyces venezuelae]CUM36955.1 Gluconolactonase [Streptomyces venezuelae]
MLHLRAEPCSPPPGHLPEGPVWDTARQELLWVDITEGLVHRAALTHEYGRADLAPTAALRFDRPVGAAVPCASGALLAAVGTAFVHLEDGHSPAEAVELAGLVLPDDGVPRRLNDASVDPAGRLLGGTMAYDERPGAGALYRLDGDGLITLVEDITISNGLGWSPDGTLLYYADSPTRRVDVFDYAPSTGSLSGRRPFAVTDSGYPDGLTVDADGNVWVAVWGGGEVLAFTPRGVLHARVEVPASHVTSCAFAGPGLDFLVITTATHHLPDERRRVEPDAGRLFVCRPGVTGLPATPYADR